MKKAIKYGLLTALGIYASTAAWGAAQQVTGHQGWPPGAGRAQGVQYSLTHPKVFLRSGRFITP